MGPFTGKRNMALGVKNILEEYLQEANYELLPTADTEVKIKLVFFDVKNIGTNVGIISFLL